ncbi:hypothetical protein GCM10025859_00730 [Alicyclobacillus fastidiosus]|nr:hypothetical protein GCM10025859_00730 [Alicyclobacillus fastidiosus]
MERTGHYWFNIANWLIERGIDAVLVNPMTTKRNKENRDNSPSKSDPKDAIIIADVISRGYYTAFRPSDEVFRRLQVLVKNREHWVVESGRIENRITRWLDIRFPEYTKVFKEISIPRSLATLRSFPSPSDLTSLTLEQVIEAWSEHMSRPGGTRGMRKATQLIAIARNSVGDVCALEEDKWELQYLLDAYERVRKIIAESDQRIQQLLPQVPCADLIRSVGATVPATAAILAFGGDLHELRHGNQLLRKAGFVL